MRQPVGESISPLLTQNSAHSWHIADLWSGNCEEISPFIHMTSSYKELMHNCDEKTGSPIGQREELQEGTKVVSIRGEPKLIGN